MRVPIQIENLILPLLLRVKKPSVFDQSFNHSFFVSAPDQTEMMVEEVVTL